MAKVVIQPHVRLQEWVAEEHDYFADKGLDYEFQDGGALAGASRTTSAVRTPDNVPIDARSGAFEDMAQGRGGRGSASCSSPTPGRCTRRPIGG